MALASRNLRRASASLLAALFACATIVGCRKRAETIGKDDIDATSTSSADDAAIEIATLEQLTHEDAATGPELSALDACARAMAPGAWKFLPYTMVGNFFEASWCRGKGARDDCQIAGSTEDHRDQHVIVLWTLRYPDVAPSSGIGINALWVPKSTGWGATFDFSDGGGNVAGDGFRLRFRHYASATDDPTDEVTIGRDTLYRVFDDEHNVGRSALPLRVDLARYLGSAIGFRDAGLDHVTRARADVAGMLASHKVPKAVYGKSPRPGLPPERANRRATAAEEASELAKANAYFDERERLLRAHHEEMYRALTSAFPVDRCWK